MDVLFWSGGKDSYLALMFYLRKYEKKNLVLLTTYSESSGTVPHQKISINKIKKQAEHLGRTLIEVPLPDNCPNTTYLQTLEEVLKKQEEQVENLVFGDWRLEEIRQWREQEFGKMGYNCLFPIWNKTLHELLPVLVLNPVKVKIRAVDKEFQKYIRIGETYDQFFVRTLPGEIDPMGENGEFHTEVVFEDLKDRIV